MMFNGERKYRQNLRGCPVVKEAESQNLRSCVVTEIGHRCGEVRRKNGEKRLAVLTVRSLMALKIGTLPKWGRSAVFDCWWLAREQVLRMINHLMLISTWP